MAVLIMPVFIAAEDELTLADIADAQEDSTAYIETLSTTVNSVLEFEGKKTGFSFEYTLAQDAEGNKKMMVTSHGTFTMQYLVDTADNSVTILMGDGSKKRYELTESQKQMLQQMSGIGSFGGFGDIRSMYARKGGSVSDIKEKRNSLRVKELETTDTRLKVTGRDWLNKNKVYVEYTNKDAQKLKDRLDEKMAEAQSAKADSKGGKLLKERFVNKIKKHGDKMLEYNPSVRKETINLKTGRVEMTELFNDNGKKIGTIKTNRTKKIKVKVSENRRKEINERRKLRNAEKAGISAESEDAPVSKVVEAPAENEIELVTEAETEMESGVGKSKMTMKMEGIKVNEPVDFKWMEVKRGGKNGGKK